MSVIKENRYIASENAWDIIYWNDPGKDIMSGSSSDVYVKDYLKDNIGTDVVIIRFIGDNVDGDAVSRRTIMIDKDSLNQLLLSSIIYPCIEANGLLGRNVIRDRPLYSLKLLETLGAVEQSILDSLLAQDGNLFLLIRYAHEKFVAVASNQILNNENLNDEGEPTWQSGIHCAAGAEPVKLYFAVSIDFIDFQPIRPSRLPPRPPLISDQQRYEADISCLIDLAKKYGPLFTYVENGEIPNYPSYIHRVINKIGSYSKTQRKTLLQELTKIFDSISDNNWSRISSDYDGYLTKKQRLTYATKHGPFNELISKLHDNTRERLLLIYHCLISIVTQSLPSMGGKQKNKSKKTKYKRKNKSSKSRNKSKRRK